MIGPAWNGDQLLSQVLDLVGGEDGAVSRYLHLLVDAEHFTATLSETPHMGYRVPSKREKFSDRERPCRTAE